MAKLTEEDIAQILKRVLDGEPKSKIAKDMGISVGYIYWLMKNKNVKLNDNSSSTRTDPGKENYSDEVDSIPSESNETISKMKDDLNIAKIIIGGFEIERWKAEHK